MDSKAASSRNYQDYVPNTEIVQEEDCQTLLISLPGFRKDQLRVQLTSTPTLKISGERPVGGNKWIRFQKEYPVSSNCDKNKITAKFDVGILYIRQPKIIIPAGNMDKEPPKNEAHGPEKTETEPQPPLPQPEEMKNASNQGDNAKSGEKMEGEDKVAPKFDKGDDGDVAQKSKEEEEKQRKWGVEDAGEGKRKMFDEFERGELMTGRIEIAKKVGKMMSIAVVVLSAVVIGIYVKNLIMPAKNYEN